MIKKTTLPILLSIVLIQPTMASKTIVSPPDTFSGWAWVIDGDSLRITLPNHNKVEVRIFGINAPEMPTDTGRSAKHYMISLIKQDRTVSCRAIDIDKYKRTVAVCKNSTGDLAENLLKAGKAVVYRHFIKNAKKSLQERYFKAEKIGNKNK